MSEHAKQRAQERYGIALDDDDLTAICAQIRRGKAECLTPQSKTKVFRVDHKGTALVALCARGEVVTFLQETGWL